MASVGVRELRQHASVLLERVAAGESLDITNRGRLVARLVPALTSGRTRSDLLASGDLFAGRGTVLEIAPVPRPRSVRSVADLLDEARGER